MLAVFFEASIFSSDILLCISDTSASVFLRVSERLSLLALNILIEALYSDKLLLISVNLSDMSDNTLVFVREAASVELRIVTTTVSINVSLIVSCKVDFPDCVILLAIAFFLAFS